MMLAPFLLTISSANTCVGIRVPMKFKLNTKETPSASRSKNVFICPRSSGTKYSSSVVAFGLLPPAPLIKISQVPKSAAIWSLTACTLAFSSTLHLYPFAI